MQPSAFPSFGAIARAGHEDVVFCSDASAGLRAIVAIHDTRLGPSLGGCRMHPYANEEAALTDVLRLSQGMTYKAAVSGLALGGGKAVIIADPKVDKTEALWRAFGRLVHRLQGRYITAEDVGTSPDDMGMVCKETKHVVGSPSASGGSGDPSPMTALGVLCGMRAAANEAFGTPELAGRRVAVQGCGHVGRRLIGLLVEEGATVVACDVDRQAAASARVAFGVELVEPDALLLEPCDILAPCALGGILHAASIERLQCRVVAGAANNQLSDEREDGVRLEARGIVYAPDYVINAGGLINVADELAGYDHDRAESKVRAIYATTAQILAHAKGHGVPPGVAARAIAEKRLALAAKGAHATAAPPTTSLRPRLTAKVG